jgi:hypothetical protein
VRGLTRPSTASTIGMLLVTAALFAAGLWGINPRFMREVPTGYLLTEPHDYFAFLSGEAFKLQQRPDAPQEVLLLGASAAASAISSEEELDRLLEQRLDRTVPVHNLCVPGFNLWEMAGMLDFIGDDFDGVVVISVGRLLLCDTLEQLSRIYESRRLAFRSAAMDEEAHRNGLAPPPLQENYFLENFKFFTVRTMAAFNVVRGPVIPTHRPNMRPIDSEERWRHHLAWVNSEIDLYDANVDRNLGVLERMIERARTRGQVRFVLLEAPRNPRAAPDLQPAHFAHHQSILREFAAEHDVMYWSLDDDAEFSAEEFSDFCHITDDHARNRFTELLADHLAEMLVSPLPDQEYGP